MKLPPLPCHPAPVVRVQSIKAALPANRSNNQEDILDSSMRLKTSLERRPVSTKAISRNSSRRGSYDSLKCIREKSQQKVLDLQFELP